MRQPDRHGKLIAADIDPIAAKQTEKPKKPFSEAANELIESLSIGWKNPKHKQQWPNTLNTHAKSLMSILRRLKSHPSGRITFQGEGH